MYTCALTVICVCVNLQDFTSLWGAMELYPGRHPTSVLESCLLDFPVSYLVSSHHTHTHIQSLTQTSNVPHLLSTFCCVLVYWLPLVCVCVSVYAGCCCPSCSLMHGRELSPELERWKRPFLKMLFIMAPTSSSSSLYSYMWLLIHSGISHGKSTATWNIRWLKGWC